MNQEKNTYLIGFSGGADSTAALLWTLENLREQALQTVAVHFNHHLRGSESDSEAVNAAAFAAERNVEFLAIDLDIAPGANLESRARCARLSAWKDLCRKYKNPVVVTGHHQDDCIENMFLRIGRGSNVSGLTGLQKNSVVEGVKFFRPLLDMSRAEVEDFLRARGVVSWAVDSSNLNCDYSRNALRNRILPELYEIFPGGRNAVVQTLKNLSEDAAVLDRMAFTYFNDAGDGHCTVDFWRNYAGESALGVRMLRLLCKEFFHDDSPVSAASFERFTAAVSAGSSGCLPLDGKRTLRFAGNRIFPADDTPAEVVWHWKEFPEIIWNNCRLRVKYVRSIPEQVLPDEAYFDAGSFPEKVTVGAPLPGDVMLPFGAKEPVKVKKLRIGRKIPAYPVLPLLYDRDRRVLWMPFCRHSGHCPVRAGGEIIRIFGEKTE